MINHELVTDYLTRASGRMKAVTTLYGENLWADVVRESQEVIELALKALLRASGIDVPRVHDVSSVLREEKDRLSKIVHPHLERIIDVSQEARRDRELAFYGSEDVTPSSFYREKHAKIAIENANFILDICLKATQV